jgi:hypothetical protein
MTMKFKIFSIAVVATLASAGSVFAKTPVHGAGSSHNPIVVHPVHGPGSSHNPSSKTQTAPPVIANVPISRREDGGLSIGRSLGTHYGAIRGIAFRAGLSGARIQSGIRSWTSDLRIARRSNHTSRPQVEKLPPVRSVAPCEHDRLHPEAV